MKRYYSNKLNKQYLQGSTITIKNNNTLFSGIPTEKQLKDWGFEECIEPIPTEPTEQDKIIQRMNEIQSELSSMDYLTSKFIDNEDMSEYNEWQEKRRLLREEYRKLELELNNNE